MKASGVPQCCDFASQSTFGIRWTVVVGWITATPEVLRQRRDIADALRSLKEVEALDRGEKVKPARPTPTQLPGVWTQAEVARQLGKSQKSVSRLEARGLLRRVVRKGERPVLYTDASVQAFLTALTPKV